MATRGDVSTHVSTEMESSSRSSSELSLQYSSSPFEGHSNSPEDLGEERTIEPYMYEPYRDDDDESARPSDEEFRTDRLGNNDW